MSHDTPGQSYPPHAHQGPTGVAGGFAPGADASSLQAGGPVGPHWPHVTPAELNRRWEARRQMTLGDLLLENRIVFLEGVINDAVANLAVMKLLYLQYENKKQEIHFYINSPGGSVSSTLAIYDTMQFLECPIATYCIGMAASGAAVLLAGGTKGKRYALPHSTVMIHQPHGGVGGQVSDIDIQVREILRMKQIFNQILSQHTSQSVEQVAKDVERDRYLDAAAAKEYGLVDEVLVKLPADQPKPF